MLSPSLTSIFGSGTQQLQHQASREQPDAIATPAALAQAAATPSRNLAIKAINSLPLILLLGSGAAIGAAGSGYYNSRPLSTAQNILSQVEWSPVGNLNPDLPKSFLAQVSLLKNQTDGLRASVTTGMGGLAHVDSALFGRLSGYFSDLKGFHDVQSLFQLLRDAASSADFFEFLPRFIRSFFADKNIGATIAPQLASDFYHPDEVSLQELTKDDAYRSAYAFNPVEAKGLQSLNISGLPEPLPLALQNSSDVFADLCWKGADQLKNLTGQQIAHAIEQFAAMIDGASDNDTYITPAKIEFANDYRVSALRDGFLNSNRLYGTVYPARNEVIFKNNTVEVDNQLSARQNAATQLHATQARFENLSESLLDTLQQQQRIGSIGASVAGGIMLLAVLSKYAPVLYRQAYTALGLAPRDLAASGLHERLMPTGLRSDANAADAQRGNALLQFARRLSTLADQDPALQQQLADIAATVAGRFSEDSTEHNETFIPSSARIQEIQDESVGLENLNSQPPNLKFIHPNHSALVELG